MSNEYIILGTIAGDSLIGDRPGCQPFTDIFQKEVLDTTSIAWYVDYYTEDAERYNVRHFSKSPLLHWTNENILQRDPATGGSLWSSDQVAEWFTSDGFVRPKGTYAHTFEFVAGHTAEDSTHIVRIEAGRVIINGKLDERAWDRYVIEGIRGALSDFRIKRLVSLTIEQVA